MSDDTDDPMLLAAEFVLGTLEPAAAQALAQRAQGDPALASAILRWQQQLDPLTTLAEPAPPDPDLWRRLEAEIGGPPAALSPARSGLAVWRATAAAAIALAAAFGALALLRPPPPIAVATLTAPGSLEPKATAQVLADGTLRFAVLDQPTMAAAEVADLWALPVGASQPMLLGSVAGRQDRFRIPRLPAGSQLMVTRDAAGGSTAEPGPTLFAGVLTGVE